MTDKEKTVKVYVVDDQRSVRKLLLASLCHEFEAQAFEGAREALDACYQDPPDIVLSDLVMPGMSGMDLIREMKSSQTLNLIPVILLTSTDDVSKVKEALELGAHDYLLKPCLPVELTARLKAAWRFASAQKELKDANEKLSSAYRLIKQETEEIGSLQRMLIPGGVFRSCDWFDVSMYYRPCMDSGGDFFDIVELAEGKWAFAIADVSGHGARSTVIMAVLKSLFTEYVHDVADPSELLTIINQKLLQCLPVKAFITFFLTFIDFRAKKMMFSSSGHELPLLYRGATREFTPLETQSGYPLLLDRDSVYSLHETTLEKGDRLFLYTDGLYDVKGDGEQRMGYDNFLQIMKVVLRQQPEGVQGKLGDLIDRYIARGSQPDDITWLSLEVK